MEQVNKCWKTTAIIFIILFSVLLLLNMWVIADAARDEKRTLNCYYNICEDYPEAHYDIYIGVCYCYDFDKTTGEYTIVKTKYI